MNLKKILSIAATIALCAFATSGAEENTRINGHSVGLIELGQAFPLEEIEQAICQAAAKREWSIIERQPDRVVIYLAHRKYESTLSFSLTESQIEVFSDSYKIKKLENNSEPQKIERIKEEDPKGWIDNLKKDIPLFLNRIHNGL